MNGSACHCSSSGVTLFLAQRNVCASLTPLAHWQPVSRYTAANLSWLRPGQEPCIRVSRCCLTLMRFDVIIYVILRKRDWPLISPSSPRRQQHRGAWRVYAAPIEIENTVEEDAVLPSPFITPPPLKFFSTSHRFDPDSSAYRRIYEYYKTRDIMWWQMEKMDSSLEAVKRSFASVRTGRASPAMLDRVEVGESPYTLSPTLRRTHYLLRLRGSFTQNCTP